MRQIPEGVWIRNTHPNCHLHPPPPGIKRVYPPQLHKGDIQTEDTCLVITKVLKITSFFTPPISGSKKVNYPNFVGKAPTRPLVTRGSQGSRQHVYCSRMTSRMPAMMAALIPPAIGSVTSHARTMLRKIDQSTFSRDRKWPTKTTEPTLQWVVLMGMPMLDAINTVSADPISMQKPL